MFSDSMMLGGGRKAAFSIANSVRLDGTADYFSRTFIDPTTQGRWTVSLWFKRSQISQPDRRHLIGGNSLNDGTRFAVFIDANDSLRMDWDGQVNQIVSLRKFRDTNAWYHLVISFDGTAASNQNRLRIWINGGLETEFISFNASIPSTVSFNRSTQHFIGSEVASGHFSGYFAEICFIDGSDLSPSDFGETDPVTGAWRPKKPSDLVANLPVYTMISPAAGTIIGNMTSGAGLAGLFDGNLSEPNPSQPYYADDLGWGGKAWGVGNERTVAYAIAYGSSNYGFYNNGYSVTLSLQGSNDGGSSWTTLGTTTFDDDGTDKPRRIDATTLAPYERHRILIDVYSGAAKASEFQFYEQAGLTVYGTNGFHLDFADPANLGKDVSGNANHWTPVSLGEADVVADSPTNNYCTLSPIDITGTPTPSNGSLELHGAYTTPYNVRGTIAISDGKWYWEVRTGNGEPLIGVLDTDSLLSSQNTLLSFPKGYCYSSEGQKRNNGIMTPYGESWGDVTIGVALDLTEGNSSLTFYKNGVSQGVAFSGLSGNFAPCLSRSGLVGNFDHCTANFGQFPFTYAPPAGFKSLCSANLPTPVIQSPAKHFGVVTYTGTGAAQSITGLDFQPDLVWCKRRDNAESHGIYDSLRGPTKMLSSDTANAEATEANGVVSFDTGGFTANGATATNSSGGNYAAWCWKAGGAAVANTDGSIPSQVSANPTAGFSIVKTTTTGSGVFTIGHGLGSVPSLILWKSLGVNDWGVYHSAPGVTKASLLNSTMAFATSSAWDNTAPTAAVFSVSGWGANDYVAYCWAEIPGFSKFGSYTGNGSTDGPYVHCGFHPRWIMAKRVDSTGDWLMFDTERDRYNPVLCRLFANTTAAESVSVGYIDATTAGFKLRNSGTNTNASGGAYIYAAFAEYPFGGAKTTPAKAR